MRLLEILFGLCVGSLAIYGYHALLMAWYRQRRLAPPERFSPVPAAECPLVTVQLPIYNEPHVVDRLIRAAAAIDYPRRRLQIQVLDDSTDQTPQIAAPRVAALQTEGVNIIHLRRSQRSGYKGGALEHGLKSATGEYIAIFDADFLPLADFLRRLIAPLLADPQLGCVQARWGHLNRESSWLTRAQACGIDGHFYIEQSVRSGTDLLMNFNGSAGIWRRSCIEAAGGWQSDTLTEDLDLSYRAQLLGWKIGYIEDVIAPAELPLHLGALRQQQFRWAKGSLQTARKLLLPLWRSDQRLLIKLAATLHLTHYLVHPLMLLNLLLILPLALYSSPLIWLLPFFTAAALGPLLMYWLALREQGSQLSKRLASLLMLLIIGMGMSFSNSRAAIEGLLGIRSPFKRTPKYALQGREGERPAALDPIAPDFGRWIELLLAIYAALLLLLIPGRGLVGPYFWLLLYTLGYGYASFLNLREALAGSQLGSWVGALRRLVD